MSDNDVQPSTGPILGPHSPLPGRLILHHFKQQDKYTIRNFHTIRMLADYPICMSFHPSSSSTSWCTVGAAGVQRRSPSPPMLSSRGRDRCIMITLNYTEGGHSPKDKTYEPRKRKVEIAPNLIAPEHD